MDASILINFLIWGILTLVLSFRTRIAVLARVFLILAFLGHAFFWYPEIISSIEQVQTLHWENLQALFFLVAKEATWVLNWLWPLSLGYLFYLSSDKDSSVVIVILSIITAITWGLYYWSLL